MGLSCSALSTMASTSSRERFTCELLLPYFCSTYSSVDSWAECAAAVLLLLVVLSPLLVPPLVLLLVLVLQA